MALFAVRTTIGWLIGSFYEGLTWKDNSDKAKVPEEKQRAYKKAVLHYTKALELDLQQPAIYNNRW